MQIKCFSKCILRNVSCLEKYMVTRLLVVVVSWSFLVGQSYLEYVHMRNEMTKQQKNVKKLNKVIKQYI